MLHHAITVLSSPSVGSIQARWLDPKLPFTVSSPRIFDQQPDALAFAGQASKESGKIFMVGTLEALGSPTRFITLETSMGVDQPRREVRLDAPAFQTADGKVTVEAFCVGTNVRFGPTTDNPSLPRWTKFLSDVDDMRSRAPVKHPFADFKAPPADQARTALAYYTRALPDAVFLGIETGRQIPGNSAVVAVLGGVVGLAVDAVELVPALAVGTVHLVAAGVRAALDAASGRR